MNNPKYTFLVPIFKGKFLKEALDSIQGQTYKDFKVIIGNDCSPEDLYSICEPYLQDPRFTYRCNEKNIGGKDLVKHWNMLVDLCDTEYLVMASDDDVYYPNYLEEINKLVEKYPQVNLLRGRLQRIDSNDNVLATALTTDEFMDHVSFMANYFQDIHSLQNHCYKTSALRSIGGFAYYPQAWYSDDATNITIARNGCASTEKIVFGFRSSNIQISSTVNAQTIEDKIEATLAYDKWLKRYIKELLLEEYSVDNQSLSFIRERHLLRTRSMLNDLLIELNFYSFAKRLFELKGEGLVVAWVVAYRYLLRKMESL